MKLTTSLSQSNSLTSVYSAQQVLENEAQVAQGQGIALYDLMKCAGAAVFKALLAQWPKCKSILVVAGKGNNGGDGFVVALLAHQASLQVNVQITCSINQLAGDAVLAYQAMLSAGMSDDIYHGTSSGEGIGKNIIAFNGDIIVDALFGIGFKGQLSPIMQNLLRDINQHTAPVISIDVPSGLCATSGNVIGDVIEKQAVIAQLTITFIVYKQGLLTGQAANFVGKLQLASLGLNKAFIKQVSSSVFYQRQHNSEQLPRRLASSHKGDSGLLLTIGGGIGMPGAIRLTSEAALRCGAGMVAVCCAQENQSKVFYGRPELMLAPCTADELIGSSIFDKAQVFVIGPGLGLDNRAQLLLNLLLKASINDNSSMVIDADALTLLSENIRDGFVELDKFSNKTSQWILSPHPKEAASLLACSVAEIEADRFAAVRAIANKYGVICLLKGAGTLISDGTKVTINSSGNAGMASGGMGDVLSGIIAALVMQIPDNYKATCTAAYIHGAAADIIVSQRGQLGVLASDLFLPLQQLVNGKL